MQKRDLDEKSMDELIKLCARLDEGLRLAAQVFAQLEKRVTKIERDMARNKIHPAILNQNGERVN